MLPTLRLSAFTPPECCRAVTPLPEHIETVQEYVRHRICRIYARPRSAQSCWSTWSAIGSPPPGARVLYSVFLICLSVALQFQCNRQMAGIGCAARRGEPRPTELQELARDQVTDLTHLVRLEGKGGDNPPPNFFATGERNRQNLPRRRRTRHKFPRHRRIQPAPIKLPW